MSFLGMSVAGSALDAYQEAENVTAQNIANVSVPGASRQQVVLGQTPPIDGSPFFPGNGQPGTQGTGVYVEAIQRVHQNSYDALFRGATSSQNYYSVEQQVLQGLQSALGEPTNGINTAYSNFQTALQTLSNNPQGIAERTGALTAAQALVTTLNSAGASVQSTETSVQGQANSLISTINNTADQIATLNGQIRAEVAAGDNPNTYEDQRDQLIDTLSTYVSTQTSVQADGSTLVTIDGHALVNDQVVYHLGAPVVGTNPNGTPSLVVGFANDPNPSNPTPLNVGNGQLGGLIDVYNNKLIPYANQLNDFANSLASESERLSEAGYDLTGQPGGQLFTPVVSQLPISAGNIAVGITTASEFPAGVATTAAGTLVQQLSSANNTVVTTSSLNGNTTLANPPPAAGLFGQLTVSDDGIVPPQVYNYSTAPVASTIVGAYAVGATAITVTSGTGFAVGQHIVIGSGADQEAVTVTGVAGNVVNVTALTKAHVTGEGIGGNAGTIDGFVNSFNAQHFGVTASFDSTSQTIVFARDPTNIDLVHRAAQGANATTPDFTITDSLQPVAAPQAPLGTTATSLLGALGASNISGVDQNATNAYGNTSGGGANALLSLFSQNFGVPSLQTTSGVPSSLLPGLVTLTGVATASGPSYQTVNVGDVLTIDAGTPAQENVTVTAVNRNTNQISFIAKNAHVAPYSVTSAQLGTLQTYYSNFVAQVGTDTQTAITGSASQQTLASNVNAVRQSTDGINVDDETQNLIKFQNAYAAAAHVVNVLNEMLQTAIGLGS